ncbi:MAG: DUF4388 domain-containing protein [Acidobacteriota bacterium]|nr:DUF4388 domain-containing protein [Acidobacteriota bacterium]
MTREDDHQPLDPDVREALLELQRYLSDSLAPLMVADAINLLFDYPAELAANEIQAWMTAQFRSAKPAAVSDYLYHAVGKIHAMGQYQLVPKDSLLRYIEELEPLILASCPPSDRALLTQNLGRLGKTESFLAAPVEILSRQAGLAGGENATANRGGGEGLPQGASHLHELSHLIERLGPLLASEGMPAPGGGEGGAGGAAARARTSAGRGGGAAVAAAGAALVAGAATTALPGASAERRDVLLSQILSVAAMAARTDGELRGALDKLRSLGIDIPTSELFRTLGRSVPQWPALPPSTPVEQALSNAKGAPTAAMRRIVTLPDNPEEIGRRFNDMVGAAVEQLNQGSLARASRMLDAAEKIVSENHVEAGTVESVRRRAQETVDLEHVRSLGEDPRNHEALGRILAFFPAFTPGRFIEELHGEEKRERRRLLLSLLEIHGAEARATALKLLDASRTGDPAHDWHFKRNLLYLIRRIPRATEEPSEAELDVLVALSNPALPPPLVKEAIASLGTARHEKAEAALVTIVQGLEAMLAKKVDAPFDEAELQPLLDRAVSALARFGSATSRRMVVEHGLKRKGGLGDAGARLAELSGQDLSSDPDLVALLLKSLRAELPFKVFGLTLKKRDEKIGPIIEALSSTPLPQVRKAFEDVVERHPGTDYAKTAARTLAMFDAPKPDEGAAASLSGDLATFELPALLQSLAASEVTGTLTLRNAPGAVMGRLVIESGRIRSAEIGALKGDDAAYQLFERPVGGSFAFVKQSSLPARAETEPPAREVVSILLEGMRRYDEFQRFAALVPDETVFKQTGSKPAPEPEEPDASFQQGVWAKAVSGLTARAIEAAVAADSFRIRRLLARWVEDGSLKPA